MRKYKDGDAVQIKASNRTGVYEDAYIGQIVNVYDLDPPAYEVRFEDSKGEQFDALVLEEELEQIPPRSVPTQ